MLESIKSYQTDYLQKVLEVGDISRSTLRNLFDLAKRCCNNVLIGFNDYAKHLINLLGDDILAVVDHKPNKLGIQFRGKKMVDLNNAPHADQYFITEYTYLV